MRGCVLREYTPDFANFLLDAWAAARATEACACMPLMKVHASPSRGMYIAQDSPSDAEVCAFERVDEPYDEAL